ncbi:MULTISPECIES: RluA family pseudouridine synthase [Paenibacillus]|uniref:Pseudouridine synthase n=1 Tax=Paenibacillus campinasensis TaxID=66347 RepID=A0A268EP65_9BACL|nr:RluA family pseudouridine synthase [Paenibacillus campinasensis]PAD74917.1 RluA family pseudouridine synthase [Paenibacillus campinasensis]
MEDYYPPIAYTVPDKDGGMLLKTVLQQRMGISRKLLSRLKLTEQGIQLNGKRVYISEKVKPGDLVEIRMQQEVSDDILPQPMTLDILYEDDHLLVVNKEAGIIVHPTHGHYTGTLANGIVHYWQSRGWKYRFRAIHRLDQETSGVLAIAKNPFVHQHVSEQMIAGTVDKRYLALVHNAPDPAVGTVDGPIDRDPEEPHRRIITADGYPSLTRYEVREEYDGASLVALKLETGRTHQIRVHMTSIGCPLIGDRMYRHPLYSSRGIDGPGKADTSLQVEGMDDSRAEAASSPALARVMALDESISRQALHAASLTLVHPMTREQMTFSAPMPEDMAALQQRLQQRVR